ncbi:MAG: hypothetical protein M1517_07665 [Deltaproteobacteria bacterium]|nr:hypothetical protein [Deltaproteobacteria bacterium]
MDNRKRHTGASAYRQKLGEMLRSINLLTQEQVERALLLQKEQGTKFGDAVIRLGFLTKDDINWALSTQLNIPYIPPLELRNAIDPASVLLLPYEFARKHVVLAISMVLNALNIAIADPLNASAIEDIRRITDKEINVSVSDEAAILDMIEAFYNDIPALVTGPQERGIASQIKSGIHDVIKDIGPGFETVVYKNAVCRAFEGRTTKNVNMPLHYRDAEVGSYLIDILIDGSIGVLFSDSSIDEDHIQSVVKMSGLKELILVKVPGHPPAE